MANNNHFTLTLDTIGPTGSISRSTHEYANANFDLAITYNADSVLMKVWFTETATGSMDDAEFAAASWEAVSATKSTSFSGNGGRYYYHLVLMDAVNNKSAVYNTNLIIFDPVDPEVSNVYLEDPVTSSRTVVSTKSNVEFGFAFSDTGGSGIARAVVTITDAQEINLNLEGVSSPYSGTFNFNSAAADGQKTISVVAYDAAGNESVAGTSSITLDTTLDKPILTLEDSEGTTLPAYINYTGIQVNLTSVESDIIGYKIWEDGETEPAYTEQTAGTLDVTVSKTLSAGVGLKTFHAKIKDAAGNEIAADDRTVTYDNVAPAIDTFTSDVSTISNVSGHTTAVLTIAVTETYGIGNYRILAGTTPISSGSTLPTTFNITSANSLVEGSNTITLEVTDNAGNTSTETLTIVLDTAGPAVLIGQLNTWYKEQFGINVTYSDVNSQVTTLYAWSNNTPDDTAVPAGAMPIGTSTSPQSIGSGSITWGLVQSNANYMHVKAIDSVGNVSYTHTQFGYDSVIPAQPVITFSKAAYGSTAAVVNITYSDATSGVVEMRLAGDIANATGAENWEPIAATKSVTLTNSDGIKQVRVMVRDAAGNVSDWSAYASCELDTTVPTATLTLYEADGTTAKPAVSPLATLAVHIGVSDDDLGEIQYLLYGDFNYESQQAGGINEADAVWTTYTPDAGQSYMTVSDMYCTSGDGTKTIYVKVRDNVEDSEEHVSHTSAVVSAVFRYDTSVPTVTVEDLIDNNISKVHEYRRSGVVETTRYADECSFTIRPSESIIAYKVCAYADEAAARQGYPSSGTQTAKNAWVEAQTAIPTTNGSSHMSGTGLDSSADISAIIKGADYELALGGESSTGEYDGAHIVVVYVKDPAGTWSIAAEFEN